MQNPHSRLPSCNHLLNAFHTTRTKLTSPDTAPTCALFERLRPTHKAPCRAAAIMHKVAVQERKPHQVAKATPKGGAPPLLLLFCFFSVHNRNNVAAPAADPPIHHPTRLCAWAAWPSRPPRACRVAARPQSVGIGHPPTHHAFGHIHGISTPTQVPSCSRADQQGHRSPSSGPSSACNVTGRPDSKAAVREGISGDVATTRATSAAHHRRLLDPAGVLGW
jgi:hypothetical protein